MPNLNINKIRVPAVARSGRIYTGNLYTKFAGIGVAGGTFYDSGSTHTSQSRYQNRTRFGIGGGGGSGRGEYSSLLSIGAPAPNGSAGLELIGSNTESGKFGGISMFNKGVGEDYLRGELYMTSLSPNVWHLDLADTNQITSSSWSASLYSQHWSITGSEGMRLTEDGLRVHQLATYEYDLSSQYTDRTLVDKGWIDSISGSFTLATASYALEALTASFALNIPVTSSYALQSLTASFALNVPDSASYALEALTASFALNVPDSASYALEALSASYALNVDRTLLMDSASYALNVDRTLLMDSASYASDVNTAVLMDSASYALDVDRSLLMNSASYALNVDSSSYAETSSYAILAKQTETVEYDDIINKALLPSGIISSSYQEVIDVAIIAHTASYHAGFFYRFVNTNQDIEPPSASLHGTQLTLILKNISVGDTIWVNTVASGSTIDYQVSQSIGPLSALHLASDNDTTWYII